MGNAEKKKFVISISQGNYLKCDGGVDKVIAEHANLFNKENVSYIHIAPVKRVILKKPVYTLVIDSQFKGIYELRQLIYKLQSLNRSGNELMGIFIHHLLKWNMNEIYSLLECTYAPIILYVHDYYMICKQFNLLKNGTSFCGEESPNFTKCHNCKFYGGQENFIRSVSSILEKFRERITVVAPSQVALNIWKKTYDSIALKEKVIPHQRINEKKSEPNKIEEKIKVAYIGRMIYEKGAEVWKKVVLINDMYEFYYYGSSNIEENNVKKRYVQVDKDNLTAMIDAIRKDGINIAVLWSVCPETYSYTVFEAISAGCYIVTNCNSGNIATIIEKYNCGKVFQSEEKLIDYLIKQDCLINDLTEFSKEKHFCELEINKDILEEFKGNSYGIETELKRSFSFGAKLDEIMYRIKYRIVR